MKTDPEDLGVVLVLVSVRTPAPPLLSELSHQELGGAVGPIPWALDAHSAYDWPTAYGGPMAGVTCIADIQKSQDLFREKSL